MSKNKANYGRTLFDSEPLLKVVQASFENEVELSFPELVKGYQRLRVLTYSSSLSLIKEIATWVDDLEIIFGREDIIGRMTEYIAYQERLIRDLKQEFIDQDLLRQKIDSGNLRLFVVQDRISHEKLYLLEGEKGNRVISGSANLSERAVSGLQNEGFICFDNDAKAWSSYSEKYERIRNQSSKSIAKHAVLVEGFEVEQLPVFAPQTYQDAPSQVIVIREGSPQITTISKMLQIRLPKHYENLNQIIPRDKGFARMDFQTRTRAVQYIKSNVRTEDDNPEEFLSIDTEKQKVILSGHNLELEAKDVDVKRDVALMLQYFDGYQHFRGNPDKLARDYFTFMSWLYISPFICDFRNRAESSLEDDIDKFDYPVFGLLYGKSNCGKSELIRWLQLSMFEREGFLKNDWFTKGQVIGLRQQNHRYPMAFDDMDKRRFGDHAIPLIKDDYIGYAEYPVVVLSMNADKDTFESEVRKRCLIIYTGASLPDHTGESRSLGIGLRKMKHNLGNALYRAYLGRVLEKLEAHPPKDILEFSSKILVELFREYSDQTLPAWCHVTTMGKYIQTKHDKVKDELGAYIHHSPEAWSETGFNVVLSLEDMQQIKKLQKDVPDYLIANVSGNKIIFLRDELEDFLGEPVFPKRYRKWMFWKR
jgi:hypothetical protein